MSKISSYEQNIMKNCDVCGQLVLVDEFGNGICKNCGWEQGGSDLEEKYNVGYPNLVPLSKAKVLYQKRQKFLPTFEDFVNNLLFYGEMEFIYSNKKYIIVRYTDSEEIEFYAEDDPEKQVFKNLSDFVENAKLFGQRIKDIWQQIINVNWLN